MKQIPVKSHWIDRAVDVHNFHVSQVKAEPGWTIVKTAKVLNRSLGSISQDLTLASWLKTHEKVLRRFSNAKDALDFIREKKKELKTQELDL